jgi:hypothetical protein
MRAAHRHRFPETWGPHRQPLGRVAVDWSHPLANKLVACYLPTPWNGVRNLAGRGSDLGLLSASAFAPCCAGVGMLSTAANQGATVTAGDFVKNSDLVSLFWFGASFGSSNSNTNLIGINDNNWDGPPYFSGALWVSGTSLVVACNTGLTYRNLTVASQWGTGAALNRPMAYGGTIDATTGNFYLYTNGAQVGTTTFSTGNIRYQSTSPVDFCAYTASTSRYINGNGCFAAIWHRVLSASENALLATNPYAFLIPAG